MAYWIFVALFLAGIVVALVLPRYRLKKAIAAPFPDEWVAIVERNIAVYPSLPMPLRMQLRKLIKQFLHQKHFSGASGLEITDEIRVTIAAEACMLLLNRRTGVYPSLRYIIVYPSAFVVDRPQGGADGIVSEGRKGLLGESWSNGKVILAWDNVLHGASNFVDGQNVVLHEFAHQLDSETGSTNGAPFLAGNNCLRTWAATLSGEFEELQRDAWRGKRSLIDHYGATNPAEFFAVATETFFEKPRQMAKHHRELFEVLQCYYRIDPRDWQT
ncbi:MAG: zinc-dependent peptidase [Xanthomonadales bacterium]|nr:zinc-dependent peptidase [Gammaproteobacteria bacterium]MBT8074623.1 zinc-dependent peptidase [Gammaproteobacteria bacterium]NNK05475.1 zinc-dependent peptidase [Xanthomonadales bacterium]NNK98977.1 zinc-dependent peptidase [Xanthomonadales bacterium]